MKKKLFKYFGLFVALTFCAITLSSCTSPNEGKDLLKVVKSRGKIIAGVKYDARPFGFIDSDKKLKGFDVDILKEISKRLYGSETAIEFQQVTSSNRIFSLTSGAVDLVAATMTINDKRKQVIDFSIPYFEAGQAIMVPKNSNILDAKDLNGKNVIVVLGSTSEKNVRLMAPKANVLGFRTYTDAFSALRTKRGDALTTDDAIIYGFLEEDKSFKILSQRYTKEPYGIGFRKGEDTQSFQQAVNSILKEMTEDGTLGKIRKKWIVKYN